MARCIMPKSYDMIERTALSGRRLSAQLSVDAGRQ
jgi:hypothetical protein